MEPFMSVLVVNLDYKMVRVKAPIEFIQCLDTPLPVVRIFGSTDRGQRICANIHGVLPYIYIRPESMTNTIFETEDKIRRFVNGGIQKNLEDLLNAKRMKTASERPANGEPNRPFRRRRHVHCLEIVQRKTLYGMYTEPQWYVKVTLRDPGDITKIALVLEETSLGGISMQSFESHIPYLLKFTSDFNITPMGWLHLSSAKFRAPLPGDEPLFPPPENLSLLTPPPVSADIATPVEHRPIPAALHSSGSSASVVSSAPGDHCTPSAPALSSPPLATSPLFTTPSKAPGGVSQLFPSPAAVPSPVVGAASGGGVAFDSPSLRSSSSSSVPSIPRYQPGYFTQSTTPAHCLWGGTGVAARRSFSLQRQESVGAAVAATVASAPAPTDSATAAGLSSEDMAALMDGITEESFVWSQLDSAGQLRLPTAAPPMGPASSSNNALKTPQGPSDAANDQGRVGDFEEADELLLLEKESCCELEIDVHISSVLNIGMKKTEFGAELWEEERIRCAQLGLDFEEGVPAPPSTQTIHRNKQPVELGFVNRYHSLVQKGEALRRVAGDMLEQRGQEALPHGDVLTRYLSMPEGGSSQSSGEGGGGGQAESSSAEAAAAGADSRSVNASQSAPYSQRLSQESVHQWVTDRLKEVEEDARLDEVLVREFMEDPSVSVNAYVHSQMSQVSSITERDTEGERGKEDAAVGQTTLRRAKGIAEEEDEEGGEWATQCENADILTSTQVVVDEIGRPEPRTAPAAAEATDTALKRTGSDPVEIFPDSFFSDLPSAAPDTPRSSRPPLAPRRSQQSSQAKAPTAPQTSSSASGRTSPGYWSGAGSDSESESEHGRRGLTNGSPLHRTGTDDSVSTLEGSLPPFNYSPRSQSPVVVAAASAAAEKSSSPKKTPPRRTSLFRDADATSSSSEDEANRSDSSMSVESILSGSGKKRRRPRQSVRFSEEVNLIQDRKKRRLAVRFDDNVSVINADSTAVEHSAPSSQDSYGRILNEVVADLSTNGGRGGGGVAAAAVGVLKKPKKDGIADVSPVKAAPPPRASAAPVPREVIEIRSDDEAPKKPARVVIEISSSDDDEPPPGPPRPMVVEELEETSTEGIGFAPSDGWISAEGDVVHQPLYYSNPADSKLVSLNNEATRMMLRRHPVGTKLLQLDTESLDDGFVSGAAAAKEAAKKAAKEVASYDQSQIPTPTQTPFTAAPAVLSMKVGAGANVVKRSSRLTILSCEIHCNTRGTFLPNPKHDEVQAIFWVVDDMLTSCDHETSNRLHGVICQVQKSGEAKPRYQQKGPSASGVVHAEEGDEETRYSLEERMAQQRMFLHSYGLPASTYVHIVADEQELFMAFVNTISNIDPDFLVGYEVQNSSLGYLVKRGKVIGIDMLQAMSKMFAERPSYRNDMADMLDGQESGLHIAGRLVMNMWQRMRDELKLFTYSYSNVSAHLLESRVPYFTHAQLTRWYRQHTSRGRTVRHLHKLAELNLILVEKIDLIRKTSESARLYGIDFFSVLSRGSQYRVEASLLIKARVHGFIMISPSRQKVAAQAPMECIPLVMEPQSQFYEDPVVVLDYQSLYPSMMIAYNLCFSTIMGKLQKGAAGIVDTTERLGVTNYGEVQAAMCATLHPQAANHDNDVVNPNTPYVSPNGSIFCAKSVRPGILPMMVKEMLETRQMIKRAMKRHAGSGSAVLQKVLDARQLAIKLLSNVTYGYAAAGFSGRMPMAELADAIVQSGRSTLEWTHDYINRHPRWRARVVYGDTDSVFVHLRGRTKDEAFRIGQEMSAEISALCPPDVLLKFEKVYLPSILVTKKRYVGNMFETVGQAKASLDAKGIEVVRRDQCPAAVKMQEKAIRLMFECKDLSRVKEYLYAQWEKMLQGGDRLLLRDFVFSKEVRLGHYATVSSQPPGAIVATKALLHDEMAAPPYNWRVPYVVVNGVPNALLKHLVYSPEEVLRRGSPLRLNYAYYIGKCINPALDRILSLCGADVFAWFKAMPRPKLRLRHINYDDYSAVAPQAASAVKPAHPLANAAAAAKPKKKQTLMDQFTVQSSCTICGSDSLPQRTLCAACTSASLKSMVCLMSRLNVSTQRERDLSLVCHNCSQCPQPAKMYSRGDITGPDCCESLDCQVFFERGKLVTRIEDLYSAVHELEEVAHTE